MSNDGGPRPATAVAAAGPVEGPWLEILAKCTAAVAAATALTAGSAAVVAGSSGALSVLFGSALVALFFGISLAIGHFAGRSNPSGALGLFMAVYVIKVVGFATALFVIGTPGWLERTWFFSGAVIAVVVWQTIEVYVFSRMRHQLYGEPAEAAAAGGGNRAAE